MPRKKSYRSKPKQKRPYRRRKYRRGFSLVRAPLQRKLFTKMIYQDSFALDTGAGTVGSVIYSANNLYDPDVSGVGHQPRGFDELMNLYSHFVVVGSKITVTVLHEGGSVNLSSACSGVSLQADSTPLSTLNDYLESSYVRFTHNSDYSQKPSTISYKCNPNKFLGRSKPLSDPDLKGSASGSPIEQAYFHVFQAGLAGSNPGNCHYNVRIEYLVCLIEPKNPSQS